MKAISHFNVVITHLGWHLEVITEVCSNQVSLHEFNDTCHSVTFYFMWKDSKWYCDATTPELIHTKDESKRSSAFAFIFAANWPVQWMLWNDKFHVIHYNVQCESTNQPRAWTKVATSLRKGWKCGYMNYGYHVLQPSKQQVIVKFFLVFLMVHFINIFSYFTKVVQGLLA